jgi:hypothetical protein
MVDRQMELAKTPEFHGRARSTLNFVIIPAGNVVPSGQVVGSICRGDYLAGQNIGNEIYKEGGLVHRAGAGGCAHIPKPRHTHQSSQHSASASFMHEGDDFSCVASTDKEIRKC